MNAAKSNPNKFISYFANISFIGLNISVHKLKKTGFYLDKCEKVKKKSDVCYYKVFGKASIDFLNERFCYGPQSIRKKSH